MRVELADEFCQCETKREHWAILDEAPLTWGQRNTIRRAYSNDFYGEFAPALVAMVTKAWSENGDPHDVESWGPVDGAFGDKVFGTALRLWDNKEAAVDINPTENTSES
jgi:hypothetical protein